MVIAEKFLRTDAGVFRLRVTLEPVNPAELGKDYYNIVDLATQEVIGARGPEGIASKSPQGGLQVLEPIS